MATFEEIEAETSEALDVSSEGFASMSHAEVRAAVRSELEREITDGSGLDGRAMDLVLEVLELEGSLYTDGELLDLVGIVLKAWQDIEL